ncbi:MAG: hypothetical protein KR126chlam4_00046 [Candidatus Anoxychlamydiales bacterium]|uniref:Uncharacterized protein n=1 Tax=marine sediment metagenome TaxID=412755 RepID=A0A0F9F3R4_9ZZZZ|nr:hypothetical protein [Candidatus Anoxychlamydiales bacterium]NGX40229.1 hypothetical protein [Candidatus Anoxychlamydiales bacterium]HEU64125.1 hypothetical protein [Chlamydiota bacterium]
MSGSSVRFDFNKLREIETRFKEELKAEDPSAALQTFNVCLQKAYLIKICNDNNETLLHRLATKIFNDQDKGLDVKDWVDITITILKTNNLKNDLKNVLILEDSEGYTFLKLAAFCRNEGLDFVYQILKIVPKKDRDECKIVIHDSFQETLNNHENENKYSILGALLGMFHLSQDSEKTSLAKMRNSNGETLFHIFGNQIVEDISVNGNSKLINILIKTLKKIALNDRKDIALLQDSRGQNLFHLADLCGEKFDLKTRLLSLIPEKDRAECLDTHGGGRNPHPKAPLVKSPRRGQEKPSLADMLGRVRRKSTGPRNQN